MDSWCPNGTYLHVGSSRHPRRARRFRSRWWGPRAVATGLLNQPKGPAYLHVDIRPWPSGCSYTGTYIHTYIQCQHLSPVALGRELCPTTTWSEGCCSFCMYCLFQHLLATARAETVGNRHAISPPPSPRPVTDRHHHNTPSTCSRLPRASFPPAACPGSSQPPPPPPPPRLATSSPSSQHAQSRPGSAVQSPVLRPIPTPKTTNYTRCHAHRVCALLPGKFRMLVVRDIMSQCKSISGQFRVRPCLSAACQSTRQVFKSTADRMTAD
ncbi:hypothetical protein IWX91DRAFT_718 [Phyllosticta citricarpa]